MMKSTVVSKSLSEVFTDGEFPAEWTGHTVRFAMPDQPDRLFEICTHTGVRGLREPCRVVINGGAVQYVLAGAGSPDLPPKAS